MACSTSRRVLLLSAAAAVLLAVVLGATAAGSAAPSYCAVGQAIPYGPLPDCVWYVATRSRPGCDVIDAMLPTRAVLKATCCGQLRDIPAECRCRALRVMMEAPLVVGADARAQRRCRLAQNRFAPAVVSAAECGLRTVHGWTFCNPLDAE